MSTLENFIADLDEKSALDEIRRQLASGEDSKKVLALAQKGLHIVGERFEKKQYALIELEMADLLFKECVNIIEAVSGENYLGHKNKNSDMFQNPDLTDLG